MGYTTLRELSGRFGVPYHTLYARLRVLLKKSVVTEQDCRRSGKVYLVSAEFAKKLVKGKRNER